MAYAIAGRIEDKERIEEIVKEHKLILSPEDINIHFDYGGRMPLSNILRKNNDSLLVFNFKIIDLDMFKKIYLAYNFRKKIYFHNPLQNYIKEIEKYNPTIFHGDYSLLK